MQIGRAVTRIQVSWLSDKEADSITGIYRASTTSQALGLACDMVGNKEDAASYQPYYLKGDFSPQIEELVNPSESNEWKVRK